MSVKALITAPAPSRDRRYRDSRRMFSILQEM